MTDKKISELPTITGTNLAGTDLIPVVDVSTNTTSKVTRDEFFKNITGNVGIGTTAPADLLHLRKDAALGIIFERTGASPSVCKVYNAGNLLVLEGTSNGVAIFTGTSPTEKMRVNASGNVGIGKTSPSTILDVNGIVTATGLDLNGNADFAGNLNLSRAVSTSLTRTDNTGILAFNSATGTAFGSHLQLYAGSHASIPNYAIFGGDTMLFRPVDNDPEYLRFVDGTGAVFNETGADLDFRIESDTNTHAFFLRGSDGNVGIGTSSPGSKLSIVGLPTSATGLSAGDIWNDGGTLKIV